ncbi:universal stress protein [Roseomonas fluvialis]|uniref:Universal stress protein A n=1 Tax=Roseomonas fluvialis TaxID=1750527 RepID=A0ABN6P9A2_9PROT|nr:universal stress protein [Roseomonas fluvialis]BDG75165.1 universal stress protein A [Roseomonas fluvialis]
MALNDVLVHLDSTPQAATRLAVAADVARRHQAHLTGLFVVDVSPPIMGAADAGSGAVLAGLIDAMRADAIEAAGKVEATFHEALRREGIAGEWRAPEGSTAELVSLHARYADLVVLGQADAAGAPAGAAVLAATIFDSGRPVLVIPYAGSFASVGQRVLIGWNAGREATRAVHDALPLLAQAASVTISAVNPRIGLGAHGEQPGADIARHLARHGVTVTVEHTVAPEIGAADILLNRASELSADLLVVGAYGHSRLREFLLGGVTRSLLHQMTVPVLLSH